MRKKFYKIATLMLAAVMTLSPMTTFAAEVTTQELGQGTTSGQAEVVYDTSGEQSFTVVIPKKIVLGSDKTAEYEITVKGDVAQGSKVKVNPRDDVDDREGTNFIMTAEKTGDSKNVNVTQDDVYWNYSEIIANDYNGTAKPGDIDGSELTLGIWQGDLTFLINFEDEYFFENHTHDYTEETIDPTCIEKGVKTFTCDCGDSYTEEIPATGHQYVEEISKEPTCTEPGIKTFTCHCGDSYTEEIPATGHEVGEDDRCTECDLSIAPEDMLKNWEYTLDDDTVTLIHYIGNETNVRVYSSYTKDGNTYTTQIANSTLAVPLDGVGSEEERSGKALFSNCQRVQSISFDEIDTSNVTNMASMFHNCGSLTSLDMSNIDTSNVKDMSFMFSYCTAMPSYNLDSFDTSNVTNMRYMFYFNMALTSLNLNSFDTSKVTNMDTMFLGCFQIKSLNLSSFDTSNVTNMGNMFNNCSSLTSLDLSSFNTSNVTDMKNMFGSTGSLKTIFVNKDKWNTSKADTLHMFNYCGTDQVTYK